MMMRRIALAALALFAAIDLQAQNAAEVKPFRSGKPAPSPVQMWIGPNGDVAGGTPSEIRLFWDDWVTSTSASGYASIRVAPDGTLTINSRKVEITGLTGVVESESDPVFGASAAHGIAANDIANWNTVYGWGNHAVEGYLKVESDPVFLAHAAHNVTAQYIANWNAAYGWGSHAGLYLPLAGKADDADLLDGHDSTYFQTAGSYDNYQNWTLKKDAADIGYGIASGQPAVITGAGIAAATRTGNTVTITATEADTLDSVSGRGNTTTNAVTAGQLNADNLRLDGSALSSTNANGNILLTPNGTGKVGIGTTTPPATLATPAGATFGQEMNTPGAPSLSASASGGSMATATYYYSLTAVDSAGGETVTGTESAAIAVTGPAGKVTLSFPSPPAGYTSFKVYRTTVPGTYTSPCYIANVTASNSYADTTASPSAGAPPATGAALTNKLGTTGASYLAGPLTVTSANNWTGSTLSVRGTGGTGTGILNLIRPANHRWATMQFMLEPSTVEWSAGTYYFQGVGHSDFAIYGGTGAPAGAPTGVNNGISIAAATRNVGIGGVNFPNQKLQLGNGSIAVNLADPTNVSGAVTLTGGSLADGTYYYYVTAVDPLGGETAPAYNTGVVVVSGGGGTAKVTVSWTASYAAASYKIFRTTISGYAVYSTFTYIGTSVASPFVDTGIAATAGGVYTGTAYINKIAANGNSWLGGGNVGIGGVFNAVAPLHLRKGAAGADDAELRTEVLGGDIGDTASHTFYAAGHPLAKITGYTNSGFLGDLVFYRASAQDTLTEGLRLAADGIVTIPGALKLPAGAAGNYLLESDALGSTSWENPADIQVGTANYALDADALDTHQALDFALLAGRLGGQTLKGGTEESGNLTLDSTAHATKGFVLLNPAGGCVGIGDSTPAALLTVGSGDKFQVASTGNVVTADSVSAGSFLVNGNSGHGVYEPGTGRLAFGYDSSDYMDMRDAITYWQVNGDWRYFLDQDTFGPYTDNYADLASAAVRWKVVYGYTGDFSSGFKLGSSTTPGNVLTADVNGNGTWQAAGGLSQSAADARYLKLAADNDPLLSDLVVNGSLGLGCSPWAPFQVQQSGDASGGDSGIKLIPATGLTTTDQAGYHRIQGQKHCGLLITGSASDAAATYLRNAIILDDNGMHFSRSNGTLNPLLSAQYKFEILDTVTKNYGAFTNYGTCRLYGSLIYGSDSNVDEVESCFYDYGSNVVGYEVFPSSNQTNKALHMTLMDRASNGDLIEYLKFEHDGIVFGNAGQQDVALSAGKDWDGATRVLGRLSVYPTGSNEGGTTNLLMANGTFTVTNPGESSLALGAGSFSTEDYNWQDSSYAQVMDDNDAYWYDGSSSLYWWDDGEYSDSRTDTGDLVLGNFNLNLPPDAIITGIEVNVRGKCDNGYVYPSAQLNCTEGYSGWVGYDHFPTSSNDTLTAGGNNDLWGYTLGSLRGSDLDNLTVSVACHMDTSGFSSPGSYDDTPYVDGVEVVVYYNVAWTAGSKDGNHGRYVISNDEDLDNPKLTIDGASEGGVTFWGKRYAAPTTGIQEGDLYYNLNDHCWKTYNGSSWVNMN